MIRRTKHDLFIIHCSNLQSMIRRTKNDLIIKLITWMDGKLREVSIEPN